MNTKNRKRGVRCTRRIDEMEAAYRCTIEAERSATLGTEAKERVIILTAQKAVEDALWALRGLSSNE